MPNQDIIIRNLIIESDQILRNLQRNFNDKSKNHASTTSHNKCTCKKKEMM